MTCIPKPKSSWGGSCKKGPDPFVISEVVFYYLCKSNSMIMRRYILLIFAAISLVSCTKDYSKEELHVASIGTELYIYGGKNSKVFLGKLNASKFDSESIWNTYGNYGNKYNSNCIWNAYGEYGNSYNANCPFNKYGSNPPILLDKQGNFYGYFTANKYAANRANYELVDIICDNYQSIQKDVSGWYDRIFR